MLAENVRKKLLCFKNHLLFHKKDQTWQEKIALINALPEYLNKNTAIYQPLIKHVNNLLFFVFVLNLKD